MRRKGEIEAMYRDAIMGRCFDEVVAYIAEDQALTPAEHRDAMLLAGFAGAEIGIAFALAAGDRGEPRSSPLWRMAVELIGESDTVH